MLPVFCGKNKVINNLAIRHIYFYLSFYFLPNPERVEPFIYPRLRLGLGTATKLGRTAAKKKKPRSVYYGVEKIINSVIKK